MTIPTLGLGKAGCVGYFLLLLVLIVQERDLVDPSGEVHSLLQIAAAVNECEGCIRMGTIEAMTT